MFNQTTNYRTFLQNPGPEEKVKHIKNAPHFHERHPIN